MTEHNDVLAACRSAAPRLAWRSADGVEASALIGPLALTVGPAPERGGFYALVEPFGFPAFVNGLLVIGFAAVYSLNYQLGWWDIHVSPPHNIREWNNRKVALAHNPFLFASLTYFIVFGNAGIYVLLNAFAMMFSAIAMHFPPFWEPDGPAVSRETAIGVSEAEVKSG